MSYLEEVKTILFNLKPKLDKEFHVSEIGLFGSITRNDFSINNSDIDIIVDLNQPIGIEFISLADLIEQTLRKKIDLVSKKGIKPTYYQAIEKEIIYV